jgi:dipeptidyl aminopeptidase/acylaminoacyl peptidase
MGSNGEEPQKILGGAAQEAFTRLAWFPDSKRILFLRSPLVGADSVESLELDGTQPAVVVSAGGLIASVLLPDGRLLYGLWGQSGHDSLANLWEVPVDLKSGRAAGSTHQLTQWKNARISDLSVTSDGKHVAFLKGIPQGDVYVGNLQQNGKSLTALRRLTLDDRDDAPSGWTPDSKSVLFHSNRNGAYDIFLQSLDDTNAQALVENNRYKIRPRMSPDGNWVLYYDPPGSSRTQVVRIARVPLVGGPSETVMEEQGLYVFHCCRPPANRCIAGVLHPKELIIYALDPLKGKGPEILRITVKADVEEPNLDLSPDGNSIAFISLSTLAGQIRVISLLDGSERDVEVRGWNSLNHIDWAADGKGWYVSSETALATTLLYVDLGGNSTILLREPGFFTETWGIPSPDGKHLAFLTPSPATTLGCWNRSDFVGRCGFPHPRLETPRSVVSVGGSTQLLRRMALDQRGRFCWDNAGESETGRGKERAEVCFGAFATADHEHKQVHETGGAGGGIYDSFDEKEGAFRTDGAARVAEDFDGIIVRPIVKDTLQQVGIGTFGHGVEEIAAYDLTACGEIALQELGSARHDLR